ncbi:MAG: VanW family protein [Clostridium sp.]|uniref:VanW family protein n=1 Tax=Clostridium sp. TaxID=1506 RepID=UPI0039E91F78
MLKRSYRVTIAAKILILEILLFSVGSVCGMGWKVYNDNKKWDSLLYQGVKVDGLHLNSRNIEEDKALIKSQYIDPLMKRNISIEANNKIYTLEDSKLIKKYNIESNFDKSFNLEGHPLTFYEKSKILNKGITQLYNVIFVYDENYIDERIDAIEKDIDKQPVNASVENIDNGKIKISQDIKGYKLQKDKLKEEIKKKINSKSISNIEINAPITVSTAVISADKLSAINSNISSFSTSFVSSSYARSHNIELSTKSINGKILMPGEIFSFNDCVGERTADRGFMEAPVIVGDKFDSGIGGGICQVSSTLYNAILRAGIKPIERTHHTIPSSYVELGLDATVNWNDIDFKFKNTLNYPIYIQAYTENKNLYINIYSDSSLLRRKYIISSNVYETVHPVMKTISDSNLPLGQTFIIQEGHDGYKVKITQDTYEEGVLVASEIISDELYSPIQSINKVGTKTSK